jgi:hypothetical protein
MQVQKLGLGGYNRAGQNISLYTKEGYACEKAYICSVIDGLDVRRLCRPRFGEDEAPVYLEEDDTEAVDASIFLEDVPATSLSELSISAPSAILMEKGDRPGHL